MSGFSKICAFAAIACIVPSTQASGEEIIVPPDSIQVSIVVGTTTAFTGIAFDIDLKKVLPDSAELDRNYFAANKNNLPDFELRDTRDQVRVKLDKQDVGAARFKIQMAHTGSDNLLDMLSKSEKYIAIDNVLRAKIKDRNDELLITPAALKEASLGITLSEQDKTRLINAKGGVHTLYRNRIDFGGIADKADTTARQYVLSFSYSGQLFDLPPSVWTFSASGYLSTDRDDPHSELNIYPITIGHIFNLEDAKPFKTFELRSGLGIEGDQAFDRARLNGNMYVSTLFPNLVNLTNGNNRLRLKPVIGAGIELWQELDDNKAIGKNRSGGKVSSEVYYFIPVLDRYSFLIDGEISVPFNGKLKKKYNMDDVFPRFDITFGYDMPGDKLKVMAKYSLGQADVRFTEDSKLFLGLVMDIFQVAGGTGSAVR